MRRFKFFFLVLVFTSVLLWLANFIVFDAYIKKNQNNKDKTDAIVVLTGGKNRIAESFRLFNNEMADILIISGVSDKVSLKELQRQNKTVITKNNDKIFIGREATTTYQNAIEVSEIIRRNNVRSVRLVTSYYHIPRSKEEILAHNPDIEIIVHPVYSQNVSSKWWKNWNSFILVASEFNKFIFVYIKYFTLNIFERN